MKAVSEDVLAHIEKNKKVENDGWIFSHQARQSLVNGEVLTLRAPCHERPSKDRYDISLFWGPKYVVRDESLQKVDPKSISPGADLGKYTWASEKNFVAVIQDTNTGESASISDNESPMSLSFIGEFGIKRSRLPELMREAISSGFEGSSVECVGQVIQDYKTLSVNYINSPRELTGKALSAIIKADEMGNNKGDLPAGISKEKFRSPSL